VGVLAAHRVRDYVNLPSAEKNQDATTERRFRGLTLQMPLQLLVPQLG